jgi:glycosyltransferase involved in cell wall biosynthesis
MSHTDQSAHSVSQAASLSQESTRSVVIPVYAESPDRVGDLVNELRDDGWHEVVVCADDPDAEMRAALVRLAGTAGVELSLSEDRRGKGGALAAGLDAASGDVVGYVDADGAVSVSELDRVYGAVERGEAPVAVGSRDLRGDCRDTQTPIRQLLAKGYRYLARRATRVPVRDLQCGAKAFRREVWDGVADRMCEDRFAFDTELVARASRRGYEIREVPIEWDDPGDSSVAPARDAPDMLRSLVRIRRSLREDSPRRRASGDALSVALVTSHPPNRGHLAEYGEELATAYGRRDEVDVTVLSRRTDRGPPVEFRRDYDVRRVWERDCLDGARALLDEIREGDYDVVQFNVHMTYFGTENVHRFVGLALPPLVSRVCGVPVVTTMHDLLEVVEEDMVDETVGSVERLGARAATQLALAGDASTVTSEEYLDVVEDRYRANDVFHVPHGTFARADGGVAQIPTPLRIMVFGHLSPTKDVATVVEAFDRVRSAVPDAELVVAGGSHPGFPDHRQTLKAEYGDRPGVRFTGYVEDEDMDDVWHDASVVVMPYRTCTGVSGVFQLAKTYGTPVVSFDVDGMRTSTVETGGAAAFVPPGDADALAAELTDLWEDRDRLREMARANADAAASYTIADTAERMVEIITEQVEA